MRSWFTPRRMTDPLSGASFNALTDERERTLITIARAKRHDAEFFLSISFFSAFSLSFLSDARRALLSTGDTMWYCVASLAKSIEVSGDRSSVRE